MCLARGGVGGEGGGECMRGFGLDFTNPVGTGRVLDVCLCFSCGGVVWCGVGGVGGEWVGGVCLRRFCLNIRVVVDISGFSI